MSGLNSRAETFAQLINVDAFNQFLVLEVLPNLMQEKVTWHFGEKTLQTMNNLKISIRHAKLSDLTAMQGLYVDTISTVCKDDYSPEQLKVWASLVENKQRWTDKLASQYFLIAALGNEIVGYASLEDNHYFDLLYVHKDYQRQGIADRLYSEIEKEAIKRKATVLSSDVSETARGFFEKKGFKTIKPQKNLIKGVEIVNYKMTKTL